MEPAGTSTNGGSTWKTSAAATTGADGLARATRAADASGAAHAHTERATRPGRRTRPAPGVVIASARGGTYEVSGIGPRQRRWRSQNRARQSTRR